MKLRAIKTMWLRKDPKDPEAGEYCWKAGTEFDAPPHMNTKRAIERGIAEPVGGTAPKKKKKEEMTDG